MTAGIYQVQNVITGQRYIGRATNLRARMGDHRYWLRRGRHANGFLQASFQKYGEAAFEIRPLIVCSRKDLPLYERLIIAGYRSAEPEFGFNLMPPGDTTMTHSVDARRRISIAVGNRSRGVPKSAEHRRKISVALSGTVGCNLGRTFGAETRAKLSAKKLGNKHRAGKTFSAESRERIAESLRRHFADADRSAQHRAAVSNPHVVAARTEARRWGVPFVTTFSLCLA